MIKTRKQFKAPAGLMHPCLETVLHLVICHVSLVSWMCDGDGVPIVHDMAPRLEKAREDVELEPRHVVVLQ